MLGKGCINLQASLCKGGWLIGKDQAMWYLGETVQAEVTSAKALRLAREYLRCVPETAKTPLLAGAE